MNKREHHVEAERLLAQVTKNYHSGYAMLALVHAVLSMSGDAMPSVKQDTPQDVWHAVGDVHEPLQGEDQ